jgi:hypothetical protein
MLKKVVAPNEVPNFRDSDWDACSILNSRVNIKKKLALS